jgi:hypothetical protein
MPTQTKSPLPPIRRVEDYNPRETEMQWIREHGHEYPGQWIAVNGNRLVAHGVDAKQVFAAVDRVGVKDPLFVHLEPEDGLAEIEGW